MQVNGIEHTKYKVGVAFEELKKRLTKAGYTYESNIDLDEQGYGHAYIHILRQERRIKTIHICSHSDNVDPECCEPIYRFITVYNYDDDPRNTNSTDGIPSVIVHDDTLDTSDWPKNVIKYTNTNGLITEYMMEDDNVIKLTEYPSNFVYYDGKEGNIKYAPIIKKVGNIWYDDSNNKVDLTKLDSNTLYVAKEHYFEDEKYVIACSDLISEAAREQNNNDRLLAKITSENKNENCQWTICPTCFGTGISYKQFLSDDETLGPITRDYLIEDTCPECVNGLIGTFRNDPYDLSNVSRGYHINDLVSDERVLPFNKVTFTPYQYNHSLTPGNPNILSIPNVWQLKYIKYGDNKTYEDFGIWFEILEDINELKNKFRNNNTALECRVKCHYTITNCDLSYQDENKNTSMYLLDRFYNSGDAIIYEREFITTLKLSYVENLDFLITLYGTQLKNFSCLIIGDYFKTTGQTGHPEFKPDPTKAYDLKETIVDTFELHGSKITVEIPLPIMPIIPIKDLNNIVNSDGEPVYPVDEEIDYNNGKFSSICRTGSYRYIGFYKNNVYNLDVDEGNFDENIKQIVPVDKNCKAKTFDYPWNYDDIMDFVIHQHLNREFKSITSELLYSIGDKPYESILNRNWGISPCEIDNDFNLGGEFLTGYWDDDTNIPLNTIIDTYKTYKNLYHYNPDVVPISHDYKIKGIDQCTLPYYEGIYSKNKDAYIWLQTAGIRNTVVRRKYTGKYDTVELKNINDSIAFKYDNEIQSIYYREQFDTYSDIRCGSAFYIEHKENGEEKVKKYTWDRALEPDLSNADYTGRHSFDSLFKTPMADEDYLSKCVKADYTHYNMLNKKYRHICPSCSGAGQYGVTLFRNCTARTLSDKDNVYDYTTFNTAGHSPNWNIAKDDEDEERRLTTSISKDFPAEYRSACGANSYSDRGFSKNDFDDPWRCPTCRGSGVKIKYLYYKHDIMLKADTDPSVIDYFKNDAIIYDLYENPETYWYYTNDGQWTKVYLGYNAIYVYDKCNLNAEGLPDINYDTIRSDILYKSVKPASECVGFSAYTHTLGWKPIYFDPDAIQYTWDKNKNFSEINYFIKEDEIYDKQLHKHIWDHDEPYYNTGVYDFKPYNQITTSALYQECHDCSGTGKINDKTCPTCNGDTWLKQKFTEAYSIVLCSTCHGSGVMICNMCHGTGTYDQQVCKNCGGTGTRRCSTCNGMYLMAEFEGTSVVNPDRNLDKKTYKYTIRNKKNLENMSIELERLKFHQYSPIPPSPVPLSGIMTENSIGIMTENGEYIEADNLP